MKLVLKLVLLALWTASCRAADTSVYAYTDSDGAVFLSNVPTDPRYSVLIRGHEQKAPNAAVLAGKRSSPDTSGRGNFLPIIDRAASLYGLETALIRAVIAVESAFNPEARSGKGARGLMQLMPETAKHYGVTNAFDPEQNIDGGVRYLRDLSIHFAGDLSLVLAAYNAGKNSVTRNGNRIPNIRETLDYVPKVLERYREYQSA